MLTLPIHSRLSRGRPGISSTTHACAVAALAAGVGLSIPLPADAAIEAAAHIGQMSYRVIDLDPHDGIAAGYITEPAAVYPSHLTSSAVSVVTMNEDLLWTASARSSVGGFMQGLYADARHDDRSGVAQIGPDTLSASARMERSGQVNASAYSYLHPSDLSGPIGYVGLRLNPNTELTVSFDAMVSAGDAGRVGNTDSSAQAVVGANWLMEGGPWQEDRLSLSTSKDAMPDQLFVEGRQFTLTLANPTSGTQNGMLWFFVAAEAVALTPAIPEPTSTGLVATGLALMAIATRARRPR